MNGDQASACQICLSVKKQQLKIRILPRTSPTWDQPGPPMKKTLWSNFRKQAQFVLIATASIDLMWCFLNMANDALDPAENITGISSSWSHQDYCLGWDYSLRFGGTPPFTFYF